MRLLRLVVIAATLIAPALAAEARPLQLSDYYRFESAGSVQMSPDGRRILYSRTRWDAQKDASDSALWIMNRDGSDDRFLLDAGGARWSPTGDRIAYVAQEDGRSQVFVRWMTGEQTAVAVTHGTLSPSSLQWSPDGKRIAFLAPVKTASSWTVSPPADLAGIKWNAEPQVIDTLNYRTMEGGFVSTVQHLFVVSADGGAPEQVTRGDWNVGARWSGIAQGGPPQWTPDGRFIVFEGVRVRDDYASSLRSDLNMVEVATGEIRTLTRDPGFWDMARVSPDGKWIAYEGYRDLKSSFPEVELRLMRLDGSDDRLLLKDAPDRIRKIEWAPDSKGFYWSVNERGRVDIRYMDLAGRGRHVTRANDALYLGNIVAGGLAAASRQGADTNGDLVLIDLKSGRTTALTDVNAELKKTVDLPTVEEVWFTSPDGTRVQGWLTRPHDFDPGRKYPLILDIHGGPHDMAKASMDFRYLRFAAQGYLVLMTNPRGSTGYGAAFANAIDNAFPGDKDYQDLMAAVDGTLARGFVDPKRMYVMGCSGGGALTAWIVAHTDRFAAAASMCPVTDWVGMAGGSDASSYAAIRFSQPFWENPEPWLRHSPLFQVGKVKTPTLLVAGDQDWRTPFQQAEAFYRALKIRGVDTRLIIVPGAGHGPWRRRPSDLFRVQLYLEKWFAEHARP